MIAAPNMTGGNREELIHELCLLKTRKAQLGAAMLANARGSKPSRDRRKHKFPNNFDWLIKKFDKTESQINKIERQLMQSQ